MASAAQKTVVCSMEGMTDNISFQVPNKKDELPKINFPYDIKTVTYYLTPKKLLVIALDQEEPNRPRIFISAQYSKSSHAYEGQFMTDFGGNQLQLDNGAVSCVVK